MRSSRWSDIPHFTCVWFWRPDPCFCASTGHQLPLSQADVGTTQPATSLSQLTPCCPRSSQAAGPSSPRAPRSLPLDARLGLRPGPCPLQGLKRKSFGHPSAQLCKRSSRSLRAGTWPKYRLEF